jgi:hypothetical protein
MHAQEAPSFDAPSPGAEANTVYAGYSIRPCCLADVPNLAAIEVLCSEYTAQWSAADIEVEDPASVSIPNLVSSEMCYFTCTADVTAG